MNKLSLDFIKCNTDAPIESHQKGIKLYNINAK